MWDWFGQFHVNPSLLSTPPASGALDTLAASLAGFELDTCSLSAVKTDVGHTFLFQQLGKVHSFTIVNHSHLVQCYWIDLNCIHKEQIQNQVCPDESIMYVCIYQYLSSDQGSLTIRIYHCKSLAASTFLTEYGQELVKVVEANLPRNSRLTNHTPLRRERRETLSTRITLCRKASLATVQYFPGQQFW